MRFDRGDPCATDAPTRRFGGYSPLGRCPRHLCKSSDDLNRSGRICGRVHRVRERRNRDSRRSDAAVSISRDLRWVSRRDVFSAASRLANRVRYCRSPIAVLLRPMCCAQIIQMPTSPASASVVVSPNAATRARSCSR